MTIIKLRPGKLPESRFRSKANFAHSILLSGSADFQVCGFTGHSCPTALATGQSPQSRNAGLESLRYGRALAYTRRCWFSIRFVKGNSHTAIDENRSFSAALAVAKAVVCKANAGGQEFGPAGNSRTMTLPNQLSGDAVPGRKPIQPRTRWQR